MKIYPMFLLLIAFLASIGCSQDESVAPTQSGPLTHIDPPVPTVVYLIRHAETTGAGSDPGLSSAGLERVQDWTDHFQDITFDAFYSTDFNRTRETIEPIAASYDQEVILYDPGDFSLADVIMEHTGGNVLIVGHSNTIPPMINTYLGSPVYPNMTEQEFGNLYKITVLDGVVSHEMTVHD